MEFYPSVNNFTLALLLMLVTNITSEFVLLDNCYDVTQGHSPPLSPHTVHYMHLFGLSPLCISKCIPKVSARVDAKSYWLHLINFSPLQVFQCYLKLLTSEDHCYYITYQNYQYHNIYKYCKVHPGQELI